MSGPDWQGIATAHLRTLLDVGPYLRRKPCPEDPVALRGQPIGMYHCPVCGMMCLAAVPHPQPEDDYEAEYGQAWPAGYYKPGETA